MAEHSEIIETNAAADPAAQAFEALRQEVALLRRAVMGLAADQSSIEVPDYSETLATISRMVSSIGKRLVAVSETPAFGYTPQDWSHKIEIASEEVRRKDRETIVLSGEVLRKTTEDLTRSLMSAREAARQQRLLLWTGGSGILVGMLLWAFFIGPSIRAVL
jgi:hypothetical protein